MLYNQYKVSRNTAWEIIIREKIKSLPVKMSSLCENLGVDVRLYIPNGDNDGCCGMIEGIPTIYVSSLVSPQRQRFTCAHELGHILFGDVGKHGLINREPSPNDNPIEQRANVFASRLLAPMIVLHELNVQSAEDISRLCDISIVAAQIRFERLTLIRKRNEEFLRDRGYSCFGLSPLERKVLKQFKKYIKQNKL